MANIKRKIQLPAGEVKTVELPDDVPVRDLLPEMVTALDVPVTGPDGRPVNYRIDSKALGRPLTEDEALAASPEDDTLILSPVVTAGRP